MADYKLYYWPVPFRGEFVRAVLAYAQKGWEEADASAISALMEAGPDQQPVPFTGPPVLVNEDTRFAIAQTPAILLHLGESLKLLPRSLDLRALSLKVANDANDVIDEITLDGGRQMWTAKTWAEFVPRLKNWMAIWEETGLRHGLKDGSGFLLGGRRPGLADIVTATLWGTMTDRLPPLRPILDEVAPRTATLTDRILSLPPLAAQSEASREQFGNSYCGGQIEASLRTVLNC